ncbi:universal stress protein [Pontibacter sp. SGAir0037]|uniref:universal stress protein n=1 Tax=Pontibacter sp. SGAir0037 TaxID=2571030 RepID=UPI0010CCFD52|nr:universal stress protein [Pontibacter sp. SGAir0037]QCR21483.1 hypothetical protein C1N53_03390 [Pontibacter sp. SGAir0037]
MKTILVPIDYSQSSKDALAYAYALAGATKAEIVLLHVFYQPVYSPDALRVESMMEKLEASNLSILEGYVKEFKAELSRDFAIRFKSSLAAEMEDFYLQSPLRKRFHTVEVEGNMPDAAQVPVTCLTRFGFATEQIISVAKEYQADLIVMGMKGAGALDRAFLGRTVLAVMQDSRVPAIAVPKGWKFKGLGSLVFALDVAELPDRRGLHLLKELVEHYASQLYVLHLYSDQKLQQESNHVFKALDILDVQLKGIDYKVYFQQREDIAESIQDYVNDQQAEMLVLVPARHSFLDRLLNRSITVRLAAQTHVPVLSLPPSSLQNLERKLLRLHEDCVSEV